MNTICLGCGDDMFAPENCLKGKYRLICEVCWNGEI